VPVDKVVPYILAMDIPLVTLVDDPLFSLFVPSKLYDYMACARAVIANVPGETQRIIEESKAGIVVPGGDSGALVSVIKRLAADPHGCEKMGRNGREYVIRNFDRNRIADSLVTRLEGLVDSQS
jgi:glycosyltransferase involved in cell wall biosynthesis